MAVAVRHAVLKRKTSSFITLHIATSEKKQSLRSHLIARWRSEPLPQQKSCTVAGVVGVDDEIHEHKIDNQMDDQHPEQSL